MYFQHLKRLSKHAGIALLRVKVLSKHAGNVFPTLKTPFQARWNCTFTRKSSFQARLEIYSIGEIKNPCKLSLHPLSPPNAYASGFQFSDG